MVCLLGNDAFASNITKIILIFILFFKIERSHTGIKCINHLHCKCSVLDLEALQFVYLSPAGLLG